MIHLIGKFRRIYLVYFRKGYVKRQLALRKGECHQCARCCSFVFVCPMLTRQRLCRIYNKFRLEMCKSFPIDQRDIDERGSLRRHMWLSFRETPLSLSSVSFDSNKFLETDRRTSRLNLWLSLLMTGFLHNPIAL